jgi:uncharacterized SAM-binding protein YcdF (DUF218 family)
MFFFLSKILTFIINPLVWIFILLIISWRTKSETRKRRTFIGALIILYLSCNSFVVDECMRALEYTSPDLQKTEKFDYAVVLGGMISYDPRQDKPQFSRGSDRILQTLSLLKSKQVKRIIISGGSGSIEFPDQKESDILKKYLLGIGIPDSSIIVENQSRNTRENALYTKKITDSLKVNSKVLFVTSSFHMRRALGCFNKAGLTNLRPWPADRYSGLRKFGIDHCFIPNPEAMQTFYLFIHELVGLITYKIAGYS